MVLTHGSLFSGIGGFDLGFERAGFKTLWQVEIDPYCQAVLAKHFPESTRYADIRNCCAEFSIKKEDQVRTSWLEPVTAITGGFPCQPVSLAGQRRAQADARWIWPEMRRLVASLQPSWVVIENVPGLLSMGYEQVCADLEGEGYEVGTLEIPACATGRPHFRNRLWILAHSESVRVAEGRTAECRGEARQSVPPSVVSDQDWLAVADQLCRMDDGLSHRVHRGRALGNAIVPQIAEEIGRMIVAVEQQTQQVAK